MSLIASESDKIPWNKGKLVGQKARERPAKAALRSEVCPG